MRSWKLSADKRLLALLLAAGAAVFGQSRLAVVSPAPIAFSANCQTGAAECALGWTTVTVTAPVPGEKLTFTVRAFNEDGVVHPVSTMPASAEVGADQTAAVKLAFLAAGPKLPLRGHLIVSSPSGVAHVPFTAAARATAPPDPAPGRRQRVQEVLGLSLGAALAFIIGMTVLLMIVTKKGFGLLGEKIGLASWDSRSWGSNAGVLTGLLGGILSVPGTVDITKYAWVLNLGLIGVFGTLLTVVSPFIFNLTRHFKGTPGKKEEVNLVGVFLFSAALSIAGIGTTLQMLWHASRDLTEHEILTSGVGKGVEFAIGVIAMAFLWYFFQSIRETVMTQVGASAQAAEPSPGGTTAGLDTLSPASHGPWSVL
ncbi:MAG: hypothetical protein HXY18_08645 [Bryobacteraceae bacterium]|nr:hypothetical protein [Bryobacteraceae bacterium]